MRSPIRAVILLGVFMAIVLAAVVMRRSFQMPVRSGAPAGESVAPGDAAPAGEPDAEAEGVVDRALRLAAIDTTRKTEWVDDIPDLELASLTPAQRMLFLRIANGRRCGCGCGFTLAGCRRFDTECEVSGPRAAALFDSVRHGQLTRAEGLAAAPSGAPRPR